MHQNPNDEERRGILEGARNVAVVGLSDDPEKTSYLIARALQRVGYWIFPVNPKLTGPVLGEEPYASLREIQEPIDVVDVFRRGEDAMPVAEDAVAAGAKTLWMQKGIVNEEAARFTNEHGLDAVMDRCMRADYRVLIERRPPLVHTERGQQREEAR